MRPGSVRETEGRAGVLCGKSEEEEDDEGRDRDYRPERLTAARQHHDLRADGRRVEGCGGGEWELHVGEGGQWAGRERVRWEIVMDGFAVSISVRL